MSLRFPPRDVSALDASKSLSIRAGTQPHRFIGIWAVVARGRVFVRSWEMRPNGWFAAFGKEPVGEIRIANRTVRVRARPVRAESVLHAVDEAYAAKYSNPGSLKYVRGFRRGKRRTTTTELVPAPATAPRGSPRRRS